jgi:hypothetical protein
MRRQSDNNSEAKRCQRRNDSGIEVIRASIVYSLYSPAAWHYSKEAGFNAFLFIRPILCYLIFTTTLYL